MNFDILVVGSLNMDLVVTSPRLPERGETLLGNNFSTFPGGKGANQAVAAARAGGKAGMLGCVGADDFGLRLLASLRDAGVATEPIIQRSDQTTGVALITVDEQGDNTIVVVPGANGTLSVADLNRAEGLIAGVQLLVLQLEVPMETVELAISLAKNHQVPVVLNAAPAAPLSPNTLIDLDYLVVNETEAQLLCGIADIARSCDRLIRDGVRSVVVTLGKQGVYVQNQTEQFYLPAHPVNVVDSTAAGDAFVGAFSAALIHGATLREAVAWGNAAGALAVTRAGAQPSLPTQKEIALFLNGGKAV
jgi:ribokinase